CAKWSDVRAAKSMAVWWYLQSYSATYRYFFFQAEDGIRDHRQGIHEPARGARAPCCAGGAALRRKQRGDHRLATPSQAIALTVSSAPTICSGVTVMPRISHPSTRSAIGSKLSAAVLVEGRRGST